MSIKLLPAVLLAVVLFSCTPIDVEISNSNAKNFGVTVEAKPNPAPGRVKVLSKAQGWQKNNKKDGYIGYGQGESGYTAFSVKNEDMADNCAGSATWVITQLELATEGDPDEEKGSNFGQEQPAWLAEAFPDVDLSNGELFSEADKADGKTFLLVHNANAQQGFRLIYYRLTLTRCSDDLQLQSDPAWGNGGRL
jgi:hypothetical protein